MSKKFENRSVTYNILLNIDKDDIYRIGCAHLRNFIDVNFKTDDHCKPMMLKMHLEVDDSPSIGETEQRNIEHNSSINDLRQSVQQLQEEMKALKDALQQTKEDDGVNRIDKAPDVASNATQESNSNNENNLRGEHNDTANIANASEEQHTNIMPEEKPQVIDLRDNCVYIQNFKCSDPSLEKAFFNIRKLANEMNVAIRDSSVIYIDVFDKGFTDYLDYGVYFCDADIKKEFLKNRPSFVYNPKTNPLRIFDYSEWNILDVKNFQSSDMSLETAYANLTGIAKTMGLKFDRELKNFIDHIDIFSTERNFLTYSVHCSHFMKHKFLFYRGILKKFPEKESLEISDGGEHKLIFRNVNNISMTVASANVIGVAQLIDLSLTTDHFKRIYVLNNTEFFDSTLSLIVEFSRKQLKDEFLKETCKLEDNKHINYPFEIKISDINVKKSFVSIKYLFNETATTVSFIGLAKQLGCLLNPDQIEHFFNLSKFIEKTKRRVYK